MGTDCSCNRYTPCPCDQYSYQYPNPLILQETFVFEIRYNKNIIKMGHEAKQLMIDMYNDGFGFFRSQKTTLGWFRRKNSNDIKSVIEDPYIVFYYRYVGKDPFEKFDEQRKQQDIESQKKKVEEIGKEFPYFSSD